VRKVHRTRGPESYLLDFYIQFPHLLHPTPIIIRTTNSIYPILQVSAEPQSSATCMSTNNRRQSISLSCDAGQVVGELLKVQLFLIPEFENGTIGVGIC